jgi:very-short-patch-repair endonuclease
VRAAGLARVVATGYGRASAVLLIEVPAGLAPSDARMLVAGAEWIAEHSGWGVWLTGARPQSVDRIEGYRVRLPEDLLSLTHELPAEPEPTGPGIPPTPPRAPAPPERAVVSSPAVAGVPRADSPAELALESALRDHSWAAGRLWNQTYQSHPLAQTYRLDLWWETEHCVVEIDGPEHRSAVHYAADRRRDVRLQLDGHAVLRFTNAQVLADVHTVVSQIECLLRSRRPANPGE